MNKILPIISFGALALLTVPAFLFLAGTLTLDSVKLAMLVATIVWYVTTPFWMEKKG